MLKNTLILPLHLTNVFPEYRILDSIVFPSVLEDGAPLSSCFQWYWGNVKCWFDSGAFQVICFSTSYFWNFYPWYSKISILYAWVFVFLLTYPLIFSGSFLFILFVYLFYCSGSFQSEDLCLFAPGQFSAIILLHVAGFHSTYLVLLEKLWDDIPSMSLDF